MFVCFYNKNMKNETLEKLIRKEPLTERDIETFIAAVANKEYPQSVIASFITGLTMKGLNLDEIKNLVKSMRNQAVRIEFDQGEVVDSCGTGADLQGTFNISTSAAIVTAAAGAKVIKQTNSNITSRCGSSNFIEALGIKLCKTKEDAEAQFSKSGICFVHSPSFNKAASVLNPVRKELGFRSIFNFTGPLINPSLPKYQLLGVASDEMAKNLIEVLKFLKLKHAMVVNAKEPLLDEISICSETNIYELKDNEISAYTIKPEDFGIKRADISSLKGATPEYNANLVKEIFSGSHKGPKTDIIALNAGAMLYIYGLAKNLTDGIMQAYFTIDSKKALRKLDELL